MSRAHLNPAFVGRVLFKFKIELKMANDFEEVMDAEIAELREENAQLRKIIESAPVAIMDTRDALGICAPTEDDFPALYALQGKRVRLVLDGDCKVISE